ncbi:hypothetical protein [Streptomyces sp. NPDC087437]|uniref:hypothetical protein n=1 Tax=Streptomyces sp. NPDC087437 TaxID=3365789 RepID=UPI0038021BC3
MPKIAWRASHPGKPLTSVGEWHNRRLISGDDDIAGQIRALKEQPGGNYVTALQPITVVAYIEVQRQGGGPVHS